MDEAIWRTNRKKLCLSLLCNRLLYAAIRIDYANQLVFEEVNVLYSTARQISMPVLDTNSARLKRCFETSVVLATTKPCPCHVDNLVPKE